MTERWIADMDTKVLSERQPDGSYQEAYLMVPLDMQLPCDVPLPPRTIIRAGCNLQTLIVALKARMPGFAEGDKRRRNDRA